MDADGKAGPQLRRVRLRDAMWVGRLIALAVERQLKRGNYPREKAVEPAWV